MGMMDSLFGGGGEKQSSTSQQVGQNWQTSSPWYQQAPYLQSGYSTAQDLMQNGGNIVTPFSDQTQLAMGMTQDRALQGSGALQGANQFNQFLTSGAGIPDPSAGFAGLNNLASNPTFFDVNAPTFDVNSFLSSMGGIGGGGAAGGVGGFRDVDTSGNDHLANVQGGYFLNNQNPYLSQMYGAATNDLTRSFQNTVTPTLNATFGAGGRTGSGIHQGTLSDANNNLAGQLGDVAANLYGSAYQFERGQQDDAANNLMTNRFQTQQSNQAADLEKMNISNQARMANAGNANALARAGLGAQVDLARMGLDAQLANQGAYADSLGRMLDASNSISNNYFSGLNAGITGMNAAPTLAAADYADIDPLFKVGQMVDDKSNALAMQDWQKLAMYMQSLGSPIVTQDSYSYSGGDQLQKGSGGGSGGGIVGGITDIANLASMFGMGG